MSHVVIAHSYTKAAKLSQAVPTYAYMVTLLVHPETVSVQVSQQLFRR